MQGVTKPLVLAIFAAAFGSSLLFGWNIGVINVPQNVMGHWIRSVKCDRLKEAKGPQDVNYINWCEPVANTTDSNKNYPNPQQPLSELDPGFGPNKKTEELSLLWSFIVAIFAIGGFIGALASGWLVTKYGRKGTLMMNTGIGIIAVAFLAFPYLARSFEMLFVGRFLMGINCGINSGIPAMYFSEIAPLHLRGAIGSIHQLFITIGIFLSSIFGLYPVLGSERLWPILFALALVPIIVQLMTLPLAPESPKYLYLDKGDEDAAQRALAKFRGHSENKDELEDMKREHEKLKSEPKVTVRDVFTNKYLRKVTIIAIMLMVMQQLSGINAIMFYSTTIFNSCGLAGEAASYATIGLNAVNVAMTLVSVALVEKAGRKTLLLVGFIGMSASMILLAVFMLQTGAGKVGKTDEISENTRKFWSAPVSAVMVFLGVIFFATGPGSVPWFMISEMVPQSSRGIATSLAVGTNWFFTFIVGQAFPPLKDVMKENVFFLFAGILALSAAYTWKFVPETKGKTLEEVRAELQQTL